MGLVRRGVGGRDRGLESLSCVFENAKVRKRPVVAVACLPGLNEEYGFQRLRMIMQSAENGGARERQHSTPLFEMDCEARSDIFKTLTPKKRDMSPGLGGFTQRVGSPR